MSGIEQMGAIIWYRRLGTTASSIYIIKINLSDYSGDFWLLAHVPSQLLLQVVEVLALPLHRHPVEQCLHLEARSHGKSLAQFFKHYVCMFSPIFNHNLQSIRL